MADITLDSDQLKELLKMAIVELIRDNHQEVSEFIIETIKELKMEEIN